MRFESFELHPSQKNVFFEQVIHLKSPRYNTGGFIKLKGKLDKTELKKIATSVPQHFDVFKMRFNLGESEPVGYVDDSYQDFEFSEFDFTQFEDPAGTALEWCQLQFNTPFDFDEDGVLFQQCFLQVGDEEYWFFCKYHHLITDGYGFAVWAKFIAQSYLNAIKGIDISNQYPSYLEQTQVACQYQNSEKYDEERKYWQAKIPTIPAQVFTVKYPLPHASDQSSGKVVIQLSDDQRKMLNDLQLQNGISLQHLTIGALILYLSKISTQSEFVFGISIHKRRSNKARQTLGMFAGLLPFIGKIPNDIPILDFLKDIKISQKEDYRHQEYSLSDLNRDLKNNSYERQLLEVIINYELLDFECDFGNEVNATIHPITSRSELHPLHLRWRDFGRQQSLELHIDFQFLYFSEEEVRLLAERVLFILNQFSNSDRLISTVEMLPRREKELLESFKGTHSDVIPIGTVVDLFRAQAELTPDGIAVKSSDGPITFRELNEWSEQLGRYIKSCGIAEETLVPICLPIGRDMIVGILGILKAGCAYVPIDPNFPKERISFLLKDTLSKIVLTSTHQLAKFSEEDEIQFINLEHSWQSIMDKNLPGIDTSPSPNHLAYVIYTSGSTGNPKGVMVEHRSLVNYLCNRKTQYIGDNESEQGSFAHLAFTFDASITSLFMPLLHGKTLVITDRSSLEAFDDNLFRDNAPYSFVKLTPSHLELLKNSLQKSCISSPANRYVLGGEVLRPAHLQYWLDEGIDVEIINEYGPTEATVGCTVHRFRTGEINKANSVSIGRPIDNVEIYIVDQNSGQNLCPIGVTGEICISGEGLARGYWRNPELTRQKFVRHPFRDDPYAKLYHTGDIGYWSTDGRIEYLGRMDDQVKIRGHRVELGEIEAHIHQYRSVEKVVVMLQEDAHSKKRLTAYVVGDGIDIAELKKFLATKIPDFMIPDIFVPLNEIPLTPHGKVDKKELPVEYSLPNYVAPVNQIETVLISIWAELLEAEKIGRHDNFFERGGDSIIGIQVVSRMKRAGYNLQVGDIFEYETISKIAEFLISKSTPVEFSSEQEMLAGSCGLLPVQQWFLNKSRSDKNHFNQALVLEIDKGISSDEVNQVMKLLIRHHDSLRLSFTLDDGGWSSRYNTAKKQYVEVIDLTTIPSSGVPSSVEEVANRFHSQLDVSNGDIIRTVLMQTTKHEARNRLLFIIHHLVVDWVSWRILLEDFKEVVSQLKTGNQVKLTMKSNSYRAWHDALVRYGNSDKVSIQYSYWESIIKGIQSIRVDQEYLGSVHQSDYKVITNTLSARTTQLLLHNVSHVYHTEINDILIAALAKVITSWSGTNKFVLGLEGHGRESIADDVDVTRTVGWFTSLYPCAIDLSSIPNESDLIKSVKEQLRSIPDRGIGYGVLSFLMGLLPRRAPWEIVFNYLGQMDRLGQSSWFGLSSDPSGNWIDSQLEREEKIAINCFGLGGELQMQWSYSSIHFKAATIQHLSDAYTKMIDTLILHCIDRRELVPCNTPSDFRLASDITFQELDVFLDEKINLKKRRDQLMTMSRLTGLQEGMLFHGLYDQEGGNYVEQLSCELRNVNVELFRKSWNILVQNHTILSTAFYHNRFTIPVQCVYRDIQVPFHVIDCTMLNTQEQAVKIQEFLRVDRVRGIDFSQPPLMRVSLLQLSADSYWMLWTHSHIIMDGWSMQIALEELLNIYEELICGEIPSFLKQDCFEDYIRHLERRNSDEDKKFWCQYMSGIESGTLLPFVTNTVVRTKGNGRYGQERLIVDTDIVQQFVQARKITINTVMQAVWSYLLHAYTGQLNVSFGVIVSGRPDDLPQMEQRIGLYINTLPFHGIVAKESLVGDWLEIIQREQIACRNHQFNSLNDIQRWTGIQGDLFDTLLVFENYPVSKALSSRTWSIEIKNEKMTEQTNYPLGINITVMEEIEVKFNYNELLIEHGFVKQVRNHFERVLLQIIRGAKRIGDLELESDVQRQALIALGSSVVDFPRMQTIVNLFEKRVSDSPERNALIFEDRTLSFSELNEQANVVAHRLIELGVKEGVLVPLYFKRGIEMIVGLLAVLKAGGCYVPMDPEYPQDQINYIVRDTAAFVVLSTSEVANNCNFPDSIALVFIDCDEKHIQNESKGNIILPSNSKRLAYIIYTSGSTGRPKGVMIEHEALIDHVFGMIERAGLKRCTSFGFFAPLVADAGHSILFCSLLLGGELHIFSEKVLMDAVEINSYLEHNSIDCIKMVPSLWLAYADQEVVLLPRKIIVFGGESLPNSILRRIAEKTRDITVFNHYGPTEATIGKCMYEVDLAKDYSIIPIGSPFSNTSLFIVDKNGGICSHGVVGELWIGGIGLARGYLNQAVETKNKFINNPFSTNTGERIYKTGDLARWLLDGSIEYLGRNDGQVKIRGHRIELGEIESILHECEHVLQGVVLARPDAHNVLRLIAYVVSAGSFEKEKIIAFVRNRLSEYLVPSIVINIEHIPLNTNGKVDQKALLRIDVDELLGNQFESPRNELEAELISIWEELLNSDKIGIHDNFFERGGHSLLATRVVSMIRKRLRVEVPLKSLFEYSTVAELAKFIQVLLDNASLKLEKFEEYKL